MPKPSQELLVCKQYELLPSTVASAVHLLFFCLLTLYHKSYFVFCTISQGGKKKCINYSVFLMFSLESFSKPWQKRRNVCLTILASELCSSWSRMIHNFSIYLDFQSHISVTFVFNRRVRCLIHSQSIAMHLKQLFAVWRVVKLTIGKPQT